MRYAIYMLLFPLLSGNARELNLPFPDTLKVEVSDPRGEDFPVIENPENISAEKESGKPADDKILNIAKKKSAPLAMPAPQSENQKQITGISKTESIDLKKEDTRLPNESAGMNPKKKSDRNKKSGKNISDSQSPSYQRGSHQLRRDNKTKAQIEYSDSSGSEGESSLKSKLEQVRLFAVEGKVEEAKQIALGIEDEEVKYQSLYELARSILVNQNKDGKLNDEIISIYLTIITEAPKESQVFVRSLWGISLQHFKMKEFRPALSHLSEILVNFKNSDLYDDALYLAGRIYEEPGDIRDKERAKKIYGIFLKNINQENFQKSLYKADVMERLAEISL
ncbi:MAG: hypothetical protein K8R21_00140 [Leptospira sp.]|nr:hypothetical protein [Leptospira sp.]